MTVSRLHDRPSVGVASPRRPIDSGSQEESGTPLSAQPGSRDYRNTGAQRPNRQETHRFGGTINSLSVLLVDDNDATWRMISTLSRSEGWTLVRCKDTVEALKTIEERPISIVLMEIVNGGPSSFEATRHIKRVSGTPVIFLSSRSSEDDKLRAFEAGADDYVTKPFSWRELLARIAVSIRNARHPIDSGESEISAAYTFGDLTVDARHRHVTRGGTLVELTPTEWNLLMLFARNTGRMLTHTFILETIWGAPYASDRDYLRAYVYRLRRKLETKSDAAPLFVTIPGAGYMFTGGIPQK